MIKKLSQEDFHVWSEYSKGIKKLPSGKILEQELRPNFTKSYHLEPSLVKPITSTTDVKKNKQPITTDIFSDKHIDKRKLRDLKRGRIQPEAILDLHGLRRFEAQEKVNRFIEISIQKKFRLILIITGKGRRSYNSNSVGVLREKFPQWISNLPQADKILTVVQASALHGGSGAFYVYMRKPL